MRKPNADPKVITGGRGRQLSVCFERDEGDRYRRNLLDFLKAEVSLSKAVGLIDQVKELSSVRIHNAIKDKLDDARDTTFEALQAVRDELANKTRQVRLIEDREIRESGAK